MALGAYEAETGRGSVLNALAHPNVVNPVAAMTQGLQAYGAIMDARKLQAQQQIGALYQAATDENGNVNYPLAQRLAARAGPAVQMGMQDMLLNNSKLRNDQLAQSGALTTAIARAGLMIQNNSSDDNVNQVFDGLTRMYPGNVDQLNSERQAFLNMKDPQQRATYANQHALAQLDAHDAMLYSQGQTTAQDFGDRIGGLTVTQPRPGVAGGVSVGSGAATVTMSPAQAAQPYKYSDSTGKEQSTTVGEHLKKLGVNVQVGGQPVTGGASTTPGNPPPAPPGTTVRGGTTTAAPPSSGPQIGGAPPAPPGAPANAPTSTGGIGAALNPRSQNVVPGGPQIASADNSFVPSNVGAAAPSSPAVAGDVSAILGGMQRSPANALTGGAATAGPGAPTAQSGWGTTQGGQPFIGSYGAPAAAATPTQQPTAPAVGGRSISGPAPGLVPAADETARASAKMGNDLTVRGDQAPVNKANYANMLTDLETINNLPAGGEKSIAINTFLQKLTGYGITMSADQIAGANSFAKLANIAVGQQLAAIGGTDARQALFMGSNPNLDLSKLGNQQIIHMLQGNEDAIQAKSRAWQDWTTKQGHGTDTYGQFQDDFNHHFDPRVFQSQYMEPAEIANLKRSMTNKDGSLTGEGQKFWDDVSYARSHGWIK